VSPNHAISAKQIVFRNAVWYPSSKWIEPDLPAGVDSDGRRRSASPHWASPCRGDPEHRNAHCVCRAPGVYVAI